MRLASRGHLVAGNHAAFESRIAHAAAPIPKSRARPRRIRITPRNLRDCAVATPDPVFSVGPLNRAEAMRLPVAAVQANERALARALAAQLALDVDLQVQGVGHLAVVGRENSNRR